MRGQQALEPVDPEGSHHGSDQSAPATHGDPDDHLDGGKHADTGGCDDADLPDVEGAGQSSQHGRDSEHEHLEGGGRVATEEHAGLAVADGHQHLPGGRADDPSAEQIGAAEEERGDHVEATLRPGRVEGEAEHGLEPAEPVGAPQVHGVAVEGEPRAEGEGLGDDGEVHAADAAAKREEAEDGGEQAGNENHREQGEPCAVERLPEQGQLRHTVPHHEIREHVLVHALGADLEHEVHAHGVRAQSEEYAVAEGQDPRVAPDQIDAEGEDGIGQELAEEVEGEIRDAQGRARGQRVQRGQHHDEDGGHGEKGPALTSPHSVPWPRRARTVAAG